MLSGQTISITNVTSRLLQKGLAMVHNAVQVKGVRGGTGVQLR